MKCNWILLVIAGMILLIVGVLFIPQLGILAPYKSGQGSISLPTYDSIHGRIQKIGVRIDNIKWGDKVEFHGSASHAVDFYILNDFYWREMWAGRVFSREESLESVTDFTIGFNQLIQGPTYDYYFVFDNAIDPSENQVAWSWKYMPDYNLHLLISILLVIIGVVIAVIGIYIKIRSTRRALP